MNRYVMCKILSFFSFPLIFLGGIISCMPCAYADSVNTSSKFQTSPLDYNYPEIDPQLGEYVHPTEQVLANEIVAESAKRMQNKHHLEGSNSSIQPNQCGCIKAHFIINKNFAKPLAQGIFIPRKNYEAWIRFSAAESDPTHGNVSREARKMVIKLLNVPGKKLSDDDTFSQDFVLVNTPINLIRDPRRFLLLMNDTNGVHLKKTLIPFAVGMNGSVMSEDTLTTIITNPLQARYWSVLPYQLGLGSSRQAVKYSVKNCDPKIEKIHVKLTSDYLDEAINNVLLHHDVCMQFLVQPRTSLKMDVEDSTMEWKESDAPFYPIATIYIPSQNIENSAQNLTCRSLVFTPWHTLPEHRPLGMTNRLRKIIYDRMKNIKNGIINTDPIKISS